MKIMDSVFLCPAQVQLALGSMIDVHGSGTAQDQQGSTHY